MKKILITGSNGLLGQKLIKILVKKHTYNIYGVSKGENRLKNKKGYTYINLDITDENNLSKLIEKINPNFIIHTAAMTNVDACELHKKECDIINVDVVRTLAENCKKKDIHLIHISTDFIFDGEKGFYKEEDIPNPINYYGLSKLKSEGIIINSNIKHTILRTILVYGLTDDNKNNIVSWIIDSIKSKQQINIVTDQLRMPTLVDDLAQAGIFALENNIEGVFNVSSNQLMSIYEIAIEVANVFCLDKSFINPIVTASLKQPAKRPPKTGFDLTRSINELKLPSYSFVERLQVFKNQLEST
ncbi:MAG: SDR family oxidoreductase [Bacteroidota bacterium]